jgi:hypothetical protein
MFDDFNAFYDENVIDTYIAYRGTSTDGVAGRSRDLREAVVAASALFHLREHLPAAHAMTRRTVEQLCPDYALLGDLVNAAKHASVTMVTHHGAPLVARASDLTERILFIEYEDAQGIYRFPQKQVLVRLTDGTERNLLDVLTNVLNFWEARLAASGLLQSARTFKHDVAPRFRTREECLEAKLEFVAVQGRRFTHAMQLLRWNAATARAEPIDLTGSNVRFRIYQPKFDFELALTHEASGKEFKTTIELTDEECRIIAGLPSEQEKAAYAAGLPSAQAALRALANQAGLTSMTSPQALSLGS